MDSETLTESSAREACRKAESLLRLAYRKQSDPNLIRQALALYKSVLAQDFEIADPYLGLAYLAFSAGDKAKAEALLASAQAAEPADLRADVLRQRFARAGQQTEETPLPSLTRISRLRESLVPEAPTETDPLSIRFSF